MYERAAQVTHRLRAQDNGMEMRIFLIISVDGRSAEAKTYGSLPR